MSGAIRKITKLGRPRRISLEQILDAACEIGLEQLDMATLARKLGTGVATLYGYIDSRSHLLALVAGRLADSGVIADYGQGWEDALREYAEGVYRAYLGWPELLTLQASGSVGDPTASKNSDALLRLLLDRGLQPIEAMAAYSQVNQFVAGAALSAACYDQLCAEVGGKDALSAKLKRTCEAEGYDALQACLEVSDLRNIASDYRPALEQFIVAQAERMERRQSSPCEQEERIER